VEQFLVFAKWPTLEVGWKEETCFEN